MRISETMSWGRASALSVLVLTSLFGFQVSAQPSAELLMLMEPLPREELLSLSAMSPKRFANFWSSDRSRGERFKKPDKANRRRILRTIREHPETAIPLATHFAYEPVDAHLVMAEQLKTSTLPKETKALLRNWLVIYSPHFVDELVAAMQDAKWREEWGEVGFESLARFDSQRAKDELLKFTAGNGYDAVAAASELLKIADDEKNANDIKRWATALLRISQADNVDSDVAGFALSALFKVRAAYDDELYFSSLAEPRHEDSRALDAPKKADVPNLIPRLIAMLDGKNEVVRANSESVLLSLLHEPDNDDVIDALLPLVGTERAPSKWLVSNIVKTMASVETEERREFLIRFLLEGQVSALDTVANGEFHQAGRLLSDTCAPRAVRAMKVAVVRLGVSKDSAEMQRILNGCIEPHRAAVVAALLAEARGHPDLVPYQKWFRSLESDWEEQRILSDEIEAQLAKSDLPLSLENAVWRQAGRWPTDGTSRSLVRRFESRTVDVTGLHQMLQHQAGVLEVGEEVLGAALQERGGWRGFAAAILDDTDAINDILDGDDVAAQRMLLAASRVLRLRLLDEKVRKLAGTDPFFESAIDEYFTVFSPAVEYKPLPTICTAGDGWAAPLETLGGMSTMSSIPTVEAKFLRHRMQSPNGPMEMFVIGKSHPTGPMVAVELFADGRKLLRVYGVEEFPPSMKGIWERDLTDGERRRVQSFVEDTRIDQLEQPPSGVEDGSHYEYLHLNHSCVARVPMDNPADVASQHPEFSDAVGLFFELKRAKPLKTIEAGVKRTSLPVSD